MIIDKNGIRIETNIHGKVLTFQILGQSEEFLENLEILGGVVSHEESGFSLKSNVKPSFNHKTSRFFIRGKDKTHDSKVVKCKFETADKAQKAQAALSSLIDMVASEEACNDLESIRFERGGTSHIRFTLLNQKMAKKLQLTGHKNYPKDKVTWEPTKPVTTLNRHFNEHNGQAIDVLNKSIAGADFKLPKVVNQHYVTPHQAKKARELVEGAFENANKEDCLIAFWRLVTGIRHCDMEDWTPSYVKKMSEFLIKYGNKKTKSKLKGIFENLIQKA